MNSPTDHVLVQSVLNASKRILGRPINPKESLEIEMIQSIAFSTTVQNFLYLQ